MLILGHRGCQTRNRTENTLESFRFAVEQGADGIELDLRLSKDGEIMIIHDANLHRIAGNAHRVDELTSDQLASLSLRYGGRIPTLNDVTAEIHAPAILDMEIKQKEAVTPLLRKLGTSASLRERTVVSSFLTAALREVKQAYPEVRTALLFKRWPLPLRAHTLEARIAKLQPWAVGFPIQILNEKRVDFLRQFGVEVGGWDLRGSFGEHIRAKELGLDFMIVRKVCLPPHRNPQSDGYSAEKLLNYARNKRQDSDID